MDKHKNNSSFFIKLATVIADKRNIVFLLYIAAFVFSLIAQNWVSVCNDITEYLPDSTETRAGLTLMNKEFVTYSTAKAMVINITYKDAEKLQDKLKAIPEVSMVDFDDTKSHYKNGSALYSITLKGEDGSQKTKTGYKNIRKALAKYDTYITESDSDTSKTLASEINLVFVIAALIIVLVLLFTSQTYAEVPVMLATFIAASVLNKGTNFMFGEISFVSNSVTSILQLALSIDYTIILIHHYSEERLYSDQREAVIISLAKSIPEISASSLTTISGLAALMFMQFRLGFDLGLCLIKSIIFSLLCAFTLMPGLLMLVGKYIDTTKHKSFVPDVSRIGNVVYKLRMVIPPVFVVLIVVGFVLQSKCPFVYDSTSAKTDRKNETQIATEMITDEFGNENLAAVVIPKGNYKKEKAMIQELEKHKEVKSVTGLAGISVRDEYVLTDKLTPRQFSEFTDIDIELCRTLYGLYAVEKSDYGKLVGNLDGYRVPLIDIFNFVYNLKEDEYIKLDDDLSQDIEDLHDQLDVAQKQLVGKDYTRILVYLNLPTEGDETFDFLDTMHSVCRKYYKDMYIVGNSTSSYDLAESFKTDNIIVSVLSILFVILVLLFTFKSAGLPVLLIAVIEGSVLINFSLPYITSRPMFFLSYLIVSSIQMGANIDYAIVISSRYMEEKKSKHIKEAMCNALNFAFPTVFTSGTILAAAGFLIGKLCTEPAVVSIGKALCSGTLISMFLVMCVLPEILLFGDTIIEKTKFKINKPEIIRKETGRFLVNGRVRGYINGFVDADIHGIVRGNMEASVNINNISRPDDEKAEAEENAEKEDAENDKDDKSDN